MKEVKDYQSVRVADLKEEDRPRERALINGIKSLSDTELIAILLGGGLPGMSVVDMSRCILTACNNSLVKMAGMPIREMMQSFKGVGKAKAVTLAAAFELGARCRDELARQGKDDRVTVRSSRDAYAYMRSRVEMLDHEEFWVVMLNRANVITDAVCLSHGGTAATVVDVKLLMRHVVNHVASGVILVHNHPSGQLIPSSQDDALTRKIAEAAKLMDVRVLDHLIITSGGYFSYSDEGRLNG